MPEAESRWSKVADEIADGIKAFLYLFGGGAVAVLTYKGLSWLFGLI